MNAAVAATLSVDPSGAGDFTTLAEAFAAARDGDRLELASGTYTGDLDLARRSLTLVGAGSSSTLIEGSGTLLTATAGEALELEGLSLRNGSRGIDATGDLVFSDVLITGMSGGDGAAILGMRDYAPGWYGVTPTVSISGTLR